MPKLVTDHSTSNRSAYLTQPPRRRSSCRAVTPPAHATAAQHLPHSPVSPPKPSVPAWIRRDWSDSSFGIPSFSGDSNPCAQISWAARNASVAVHDVFQYHAGRWDSIQDTAMCIYLAIVDVVLQKKDQAIVDYDDKPLPSYAAWSAAREGDIRDTINLATRDFRDISLDSVTAHRVCLRALQTMFAVDYDAEAPPPGRDEEHIPLDLAAFGEFLPRAANIDRYGLIVWSTEIGGDDCEGTVNAELDAWKAEHGGSLDTMFAAAGSLRGLSPFPPGHRPPTPPTHIDGWTTSRLYDSIVPPGPVPSLASLCMASR